MNNFVKKSNCAQKFAMNTFIRNAMEHSPETVAMVTNVLKCQNNDRVKEKGHRSRSQ